MNYLISSSWSQRLAFSVLVAGFIDVLMALAGAHLGASMLLAPLFGTAIITASGELLLGIAGLNTTATLTASFVVGAAATMMAMLALSELFGFIAQTSFLIWAATVAIIFVTRSKPLPAKHSFFSWIDIGATLGLSILVAYFCRDIAAFPPIANSGAPLPAWTDYYVHGTVIASFGDPLAIKQGNILLAHEHRPFYHYGSFMLAAGLLPSSGLSGLGLSLATLLPVGLFIGLLGLYEFIAQQSGRSIALLVILIVACVPDASFYWMQNAFLGFRWLLYTAPGSGYALGVAGVASACVLQGSRTKKLGPHALGLLLLMSLFMIRVHFFVLLAPALGGTWLLAQWRVPSGLKAQLLVLCFTLFILGSTITLALRADLLSFFMPLQYIESALHSGPPKYLHFFQEIKGNTPLALVLILGVGMLFVATLGVFVIGLPIVAWLWARTGQWEDIDWLPWMLLGTYALLILLGPVMDADPSELKQRHFILLYASVAAWTLARGVELANPATWDINRHQPATLSAFIAALLAIAVVGQDAKPARPLFDLMPGARRFYGVHIERGLAQVASYIRHHSQPGDLMIMSGNAMRGYIWSSLTELVSMADVPTYIGRTEFLEKEGGNALSIATKRSAVVDEITTAASWQMACDQMRKNGVRWYVEYQPNLPRWDPANRIAIMKGGDFVVYDAGLKAQSNCNSAPH